jgi:hypothetical protein
MIEVNNTGFYHKGIYENLGSFAAAIIYQHFYHLQTHTYKDRLDEEGYFYSTREDIYLYTRINLNTQRKVIKQLVDTELIFTKLKVPVGGQSPIVHYKLNEDEDVINKYLKLKDIELNLKCYSVTTQEEKSNLKCYSVTTQGVTEGHLKVLLSNTKQYSNNNITKNNTINSITNKDIKDDGTSVNASTCKGQTQLFRLDTNVPEPISTTRISSYHEALARGKGFEKYVKYVSSGKEIDGKKHHGLLAYKKLDDAIESNKFDKITFRDLTYYFKDLYEVYYGETCTSFDPRTSQLKIKDFIYLSKMHKGDFVKVIWSLFSSYEELGYNSETYPRLDYNTLNNRHIILKLLNGEKWVDYSKRNRTPVNNDYTVDGLNKKDRAEFKRMLEDTPELSELVYDWDKE